MTPTQLGYLQDHADAFLALLRAGDITVYPTVDGGTKTIPADSPKPYIAVHIVGDRMAGPSLTFRSSRFRMRAYVYCVAESDIAARGVSDKVAELVLDVKPTIAGRRCFPIRFETEHREPDDDESTGSLEVTIAEVYRLESLPGVFPS